MDGTRKALKAYAEIKEEEKMWREAANDAASAGDASGYGRRHAVAFGLSVAALTLEKAFWLCPEA